MTTITTDTASQINHYHALALQRADEAIGHAVEAGKLLLAAKASMPYGQFTTWLLVNVSISPRQCQRYMQVAQGKPLPIRALAKKAQEPTPVSAPECDGPRNFCGNPDIAPTFLPDPDACLAHITDDLTMYLVEPSAKYKGFYFVSRINNDEDESYDCTRRPIAAEWVEQQLQTFGLLTPSEVAWKSKPTAGVTQAMATFDSPSHAQRVVSAAFVSAVAIRSAEIRDGASLSRVTQLPEMGGARLVAVPGHAMVASHGGQHLLIEQSTEAGRFFVSSIALSGDDDAVMRYLTTPIAGEHVEEPLRDWGIPEPASLDWRSLKMDRPAKAALQLVDEVAA